MPELVIRLKASKIEHYRQHFAHEHPYLKHRMKIIR